MAESTLTLTYDDFRETVARMLGYHATAGSRTAAEISEIDGFIQAGYRRFIMPESGYEWTFMSPKTTFDTTGDAVDYDLPDTFGSFIGRSFTVSGTGFYYPIYERAESYVRELRARGSISGRPQFFAIRPKTFVAGTGQRWEVLIWPDPDAVYTIEYRYNVLVDALASDEHPLGGMWHSETIKEAILAAAEGEADDEDGIHEARFQQRLSASIEADKRLRPKLLGKSYDFSDESGFAIARTEYSTYEGVVPS